MKQEDKVAIAANYIIDQLREVQIDGSIDIGNGYIAWVQHGHSGYWLIQLSNNKRSIRDDEFESYFDKFKAKDIIKCFLNRVDGDLETIKYWIENYRKEEK
tara:strand:+ start:139 stop:441 length:303 start_codon:yes stop_codon:yes gene_type:complete